MKKNIIKNIILITILFIFILSIITLVPSIISLNNNKNSNYYIIDSDQIPSIYNVVGNRKLYSYKSLKNNGIKTKIYKYKNIKNTSSDLSKYILELKNNYNFVYTSNIDLSKNNGEISLSSKSLDADNIIILKITYDNNSYEINISKGKGILQNY